MEKNPAIRRLSKVLRDHDYKWDGKTLSWEEPMNGTPGRATFQSIFEAVESRYSVESQRFRDECHTATDPEEIEKTRKFLERFE